MTLRGARVSPALFPLLRATPHLGRLFTGEEAREGADGVVLLSHRAWTNRFASDPDVVGTVIVGVVADVRYGGLTITESSAEAYVPLPQQERVMALGGLFTGSMVSVRTAGDPLAVIPFLREAATAASPRASIGEVMTMGARLSAAVEQPRFYAVFVGFFAVLALFLAAFGIYALLSYTVSRRRREIGVRMALGAQRGDVVALVVRQGAGLVAAGIVLGALASAGSARLLDSFLFGVAADDRLTFVAAPLVLAVVAVVACWLPGRRAARIHPMDALRVE